MSQVSLFFHDGALLQGSMSLQEDTAKHVVQVLRMQPGDIIALTNGKGFRAEATIETAQKKGCTVSIEKVEFFEQRKPPLHMAIAFTKNSSRNEWILEKATELGVATIIPLQSQRSEREKFRLDRWNNILVSAILQSQQYYLPQLKEITPLKKLTGDMQNLPQKIVAHCIEHIERQPLSHTVEKDKETLLLIGPEGDFTEDEVNELISMGYKGVSMGSTRLRTETAAVAACAYFNMLQG